MLLIITQSRPHRSRGFRTLTNDHLRPKIALPASQAIELVFIDANRAEYTAIYADKYLQNKFNGVSR